MTPSVNAAKFGDTLNLTWLVTNNGSAAAVGPWTDNVYLSSTPALGSGAIYLSSFTAEPGGTLAPADRTAARRRSSCR